MFSIISFGNVRMSGMGKNLVTSYAALGVGLAVVLTFGLTAISSIMEPSQNYFTASDQDLNLRVEPQAGQEAERKALEAPVPVESPEAQFAAPPQSPGTEADVSTEAGTGGGRESAQIEKMPAPEEASREGYIIATDAPAASSPFTGILMALPYIAAAAVGSAVFVVTRKRVG